MINILQYWTFTNTFLLRHFFFLIGEETRVEKGRYRVLKKKVTRDYKLGKSCNRCCLRIPTGSFVLITVDLIQDCRLNLLCWTHHRSQISFYNQEKGMLSLANRTLRQTKWETWYHQVTVWSKLESIRIYPLLLKWVYCFIKMLY